MHTGEKPHKCQICDVTFGRKGDLKRHSEFILANKHINSIYVDSTFVSKSHLNNHSRVHTGEKPHKCQVMLLLYI